MACGSTPPDLNVHAVAVSASVAYEWGPWIQATGVDNLKAALRLHGVAGNIQGQLAIQTAAVRVDVPDQPSLLDSPQVGEGERCSGGISIAATTASKFWVRFGIGYSLSSGTALSQADISLSVSYTQCGQVLGSRSNALASSTSSDAYVLISPWVAGLLVDKMKAITICRSLTGTFEWRLCYRTATTSKEDPSAWTLLEANAHGAGEFNSGELTLSGIGGAMYIQFGLMYHATSGAGQAQVDTVVSIRRA